MKTLLEPSKENIERLKSGTTYFVVEPYNLSRVRSNLYAAHKDVEMHTSYDAKMYTLRVVITPKETDSGS
jgi:hypothetical protein